MNSDTMKKDKSMCGGCYNNRYNYTGTCERPGIDAVVTSKECWIYKSAKVEMKKEVSINQVPPWNQKATHTLSCYRRPGYVYVDKNTTC